MMRLVRIRVKFNKPLLIISIMLSAAKHTMGRMRFSTQTIQQAFQSRKLLYQLTSLDLSHPQFLTKHRGKSAYCGYDPTSDSLHLGNLVSIIMMGRLSLLGLRPIFLVGGATGLIGDPSGKSKERALLDQSIVESNINSIRNEIEKIYTNIQKDLSNNRQEYGIPQQGIDLSLKNAFKIRNNYDFYRNMDAVRYLRDVGKYFRMGPLLSRQTVANRLKSEQGISYAQFSYSIIQAYDFYRLFEEEGCILQFGGSDQWGNITNGCDLIRKKTNKQAYGVTMPLLLTKSGHKFGKSQGNALFLNPSKTSIEQIHKYFINSSDEQVQKYLYIFTLFSKEKIGAIMESHNANKNKREAQSILAQSVVRYIGEYKSKNKEFFTLTHSQMISKDASFFQDLFQLMKTNNNGYYPIKTSEIGEIQTLADFMMKYQLVKSKSQVRREIEKGGLYINNKKLQISVFSKPLPGLLKEHTLHNEYLLIRWGKKKYQFIHFLSC